MKKKCATIKMQNFFKFFLSILTTLFFAAIFSCDNDSSSSGGGTTWIIQENDSAMGFVSAKNIEGNDCEIKTFSDWRNGYTGSGLYDNPATIIYSVYSATAQDVKAKIRYSYSGFTNRLRAAYAIVNGSKNDDAIFYCNWTNDKGNHAGNISTWQDSNEITIHLDKGENQIRLQAVPKGTPLKKASENNGIGAKYPTYIYASVQDATDNEAAADADSEKKAGYGAYKAEGNFALVDYFLIEGAGLGCGSNSIMFYSVKAEADIASFGKVEISPDQEFYKKDTEVTVKAIAESGYKFDSFIGTSSSRDAEFKFNIQKDEDLKAHFIPDSFNAQTENAGLQGYATICDDAGTAYTITGGAGGEEITISSLAELNSNKEKISSDTPYIIKITSRIGSGSDKSLKFDVGSNKTILGEGGTGNDKTAWPGLKNIEFNFASCHNIVVKNLVFGEVISAFNGKEANDAMGISNSHHIWIDHCTFMSQIEPKHYDGTIYEGLSDKEKKDFYDGLLDIKSGSRYITISYCEFTNHQKVMLCGSGDKLEDAATDVNIRLTLHHNYFHNVGSRLPLLRYGKAHIYNNYYIGLEGDAGNSSAVNARSGAEVFVEKNVFSGVSKAVGCYFEQSGETVPQGKWNLYDNDFGTATASSSAPNVCVNNDNSSTTNFKPPYTITAEDKSGLKTSVPQNAGPKWN